jgi:hypothetical protein
MRRALLFLALSLPAALPAQVVRGVVRDSASGAPAAGVLVALIDARSGGRRTVLTDEAGRFTVAAPDGGTFTLETKRIGVRPALTPPFSLAAGETREFTVGVAAVVPRLSAVRVTGKSYCAHRLAEGGETATLWQEVRAALTATLITREQRRFPVRISRFRRRFDPKRLQVLGEERSELSGLASNPFTSVPIATLSSHGYITTDRPSGTLSYHAPDVEALLSDMFVRDHCFRTVEGIGDKRGLVGLAFEPTSARRVPDIAGVLWLDAATRELRRLEFNYTEDPYEGLWQKFPSIIEYTRLPSGAWIIQRWSIRMPYVELERRDPSNPVFAGQAPRRRLVAIIEEGAEATLGDRPRPAIARSLAGTVFDSSAGRPLAGARVSLRGTPFAATADAAGRFRLELPDTGTYLLAFEHARLDSLGYDAPAREVRIVDSLTTADVAVPPLATVRAQLCGLAHGASPGGIVRGTIRTPAGAPAAWTTLRYRWSRFETVAATQSSPLRSGAVPVQQSTDGATFVADSRGRYLICDVLTGHYRFSVESESGELAETDIAVGTGEIVVRDLMLGRRTP